MKLQILIFILASISLLSCGLFQTCDCEDEPDYAFGMSIDLKKHDSGISVYDFLNTRDSAGYPSRYRVKLYFRDSKYNRDGGFDFSGSDSILYFTMWGPTEHPRIERVIIDIPEINFHHELSDFYLEGTLSNRRCECFTPTKYSMILDDSIILNRPHIKL